MNVHHLTGLLLVKISNQGGFFYSYRNQLIPLNVVFWLSVSTAETEDLFVFIGGLDEVSYLTEPVSE